MPEQRDATGSEVGSEVGAEFDLDRDAQPGLGPGYAAGEPPSSLRRPSAVATSPAEGSSLAEGTAPTKTSSPGKTSSLAEGTAPAEAGRPPQQVLDSLWAFAPNRDCQGGTAWWLEHADGALLVDCPAYTAANLAFLRGRPAGMLLLTSREGHGRTRRFQEALGWPVLVQEQEAYLLPGVQQLQTFGEELDLAPGLRLLWTPGPTPGACVLHASGEPDVLFCGRLLSPTGPGAAAPLATARSFHWGRWQRSLKTLKAWLPQGSPRGIASGAGLGALAGEKLIGPGRPLLDGLE